VFPFVGCYLIHFALYSRAVSVMTICCSDSTLIINNLIIIIIIIIVIIINIININ